MSVHPRFRLDIGDVVGQREAVDRAIVEAHLARVDIGPGQRVLHPGLVVPVGVVLAGMRAAAFRAVGRAMDRH